ncbi:hypothetical protein AVEN_86807-1 [Araneus ventricosus]|uniref:Uncharacterized protein n=1 Tax=Araneus ventricosus TaxID=182803 RepID=A0A4Y2CZN6_ARAVE|nr:hypothetical protein AVEN_86807-1 [Araneus ventricosus]
MTERHHGKKMAPVAPPTIERRRQLIVTATNEETTLQINQKYLSLVGSSVASERLVSALNDVDSDERCRLMDQLIAE